MINLQDLVMKNKRLAQFILLNLPIQSRQTDLQQAGGFGFVALGVVQDFLDVQLFGTR